MSRLLAREEFSYDLDQPLSPLTQTAQQQESIFGRLFGRLRGYRDRVNFRHETKLRRVLQTMADITLPVAQYVRVERRKVVFRRDMNGSIIAIFPEMAADTNPHHCIAYVKGQGLQTIDFEWLMGHSQIAKPGEYADLFAELTKQGYDLEITHRVKADVHQRRAEAAGLREEAARKVAEEEEAHEDERVEEETSESAKEEMTGAKGGESMQIPAPPAGGGVMPIPPVMGIPEMTTEGQRVNRPIPPTIAHNGASRLPVQVVAVKAVNLQWSCHSCGSPIIANNVTHDQEVGCPICGDPYHLSPEAPFVERSES